MRSLVNPIPGLPLVLAGLLLVTPLSAQEPEIKRAILYDEVGAMARCDLESRFKRFFQTLREKPDNQGYIINYGSAKTGESLIQHRERILTSLVAFRNYDRSRITLLRGGFRLEEATELWLIPPGADNPAPSKTVPDPNVPSTDAVFYASKNLGAEADLDEFVLESVKQSKTRDVGEDEEERSRLTQKGVEDESRFEWADVGIAVRIANIKGSTGMIFFYADEKRYDISKLRTFIGQGRELLVQNASIARSQLSIEFGGYRDYPEAEFWFVPANAESPRAQPYGQCTPGP
jgi:hypothetical protein